LRGLVQLYSGDQGAAQENLMLAADAIAEREPSRAAGLFFMAVDAAYHRNRIDDAAACARRVRDLDCDPGYHRLADWLAASVADELDDPAADPWRVLDSAPPEDNAHRWLLPMAISRHGRYPRAAVEFGVVACERLRANGLLSMHTVLLPWLAELEHRLGKWPSARAYAEEGLRAATETGLHATATDAHSLIAHLAGLAGDGERCREHAEKALRLAAVAHNNLAAARANWALGSLHLARGEFEQAAERLHRLQHEHIAHYAVADTVEALVRTGALEDALQIVEEFRRTLNPSNPDLSRALLHRCCALLPGNDADKYYRLSLSTPDSELRPFEQARTALRYGQ
jgi:tetratricopeptide (TPR) repeat protein